MYLHVEIRRGKTEDINPEGITFLSYSSFYKNIYCNYKMMNKTDEVLKDFQKQLLESPLNNPELAPPALMRLFQDELFEARLEHARNMGPVFEDIKKKRYEFNFNFNEHMNALSGFSSCHGCSIDRYFLLSLTLITTMVTGAVVFMATESVSYLEESTFVPLIVKLKATAETALTNYDVMCGNSKKIVGSAASSGAMTYMYALWFSDGVESTTADACLILHKAISKATAELSSAITALIIKIGAGGFLSSGLGLLTAKEYVHRIADMLRGDDACCVPEMTKSQLKKEVKRLRRKYEADGSAVPYSISKYQIITNVDDVNYPYGSVTPQGDSGLLNNSQPCVKEIHQAVHDQYGLPTVIVSANPMEASRRKRSKVSDELGLPSDQIVMYKGSKGNTLGGSRGDVTHKVINSVTTDKINNIVRHIGKSVGGVGYIWIGGNGMDDEKVAVELLSTGMLSIAFIQSVDESSQVDQAGLYYVRHYGEVLEILQQEGILDDKYTSVCDDMDYSYSD
jgi:hypothetical protein